MNFGRVTKLKGHFSILKKPIFWTLIVLVSHLVIFSAYLATEIRGNIGWHVLPSETFGIPPKLQEQGHEVLYPAPQSGWDGQFYFSIANDPLALNGTEEYVDADAYRYQRAGLPILSKIISIITLQDWVSPMTYYLTSLILIMMAVYYFSKDLIKSGGHPVYSVFWGLGMGTILTSMNGLPDAAADSLLILSLLALKSNRMLLFAILSSFAALSREAYILLPAGVIFFSIVQIFLNRNCVEKENCENCESTNLKLKIILMSIPLVIFGSWHVFIRKHFGVSPSSQAHSILDKPFRSLLKHFEITWGNEQNLFPFFALIIFVFILLLTLFLYSKLLYEKGFLVALKSRSKFLEKLQSISKEEMALLSLIPLPILYLCFGDVVMFHYTGYLKAASLFLFLTVYISFIMLNKHKWPTIIVNTIALLYITPYMLKERVFIDTPSTAYKFSEYSDKNDVLETQEILNKFSSKIELKGMKDFYHSNFFRELWGKNDLKVFNVSVLNTSGSPFMKSRGVGEIHMSYHWLNDKGQVIQDGIRNKLQAVVKPNESHQMDMIVKYPNEPGDYRLILSLVQEGYAWFYQAGDKGAFSMDVRIH